METENNKFNEVELILGGMFTLSADGICALLDLTGVGAVITPFIQSFVTFVMWMWFNSKGDKNSGKLGRQIAKYASNAIPIIPTTFTAFIIEALAHNHPRIKQVGGKIAGAAVSKTT
ncbi:MAG: hypothetical protein AAB935_02045, partial [Patescibacteria group bacterium]